MRLTDTELISKKYTKFAQSFTNNTFGTSEEIQENLDDSFGGIIHNGRLGWLAKGPYFEIFSLRNGQKVGKFRFDNNLGFERSIITSICEIEAHDFNGCLLAIGIQFGDAPGGVVAIYSVQGSKVLRCIEISDKVTSCHYIGTEITKRTILQMMQGCLAVGTDIGKIILLDLNLLKCEEALFSTIGNEDDITIVPCHFVHSKLDFTHIREHYKHSIQQKVNFGIELEVVEGGSLVLSLLAIAPSLCLAAGLEDGRMVLYDLSELQPFHMAFPPENLSPLVKLSFLEPPDDPRPCIYLWAYHENSKNAIAVMHSIMYDKKLIEDDEFYLFEDFQLCHVRLTLPMFDNHSLPINCRTITKFPSHGDEEIISLCLLSWKSDNFTQLLVFDLNQWYKEEMPSVGDWRKNLSYLAAFRLNHCLPFDVYVDSNTIALFNSIQRSEEHFYPISLSFDCILLMPKGSSYLHWPGLQNRALDLLNSAGSLAVLEPSPYFNEIMRASLMPQFCDFSYNTTFTINVQREILLSVALEYNCFGLLKECAKNWADGSHLGKKPSEGLSLSTLTDWAWQRAGFIKNRCNTLCVSLFDHSGYQLDQRNQKELSYLSRQLKLLADLMGIVLVKCKDYIPSQVMSNLNSQYNSIRMASEYQELLQWLLNIGLLPEGAGSHSSESIDENDNNSIIKSQLVPYPYRVLKNYYMSQRMRFYKMNKGMVSARTQSCRILYIDSFIEHECNPNALREQWLESGGNGLYPPPSLQAMLRTLLVPDVPLEKKYVLFIYLFLDLNMAVEEERHAAIVQNLIKFPAVFKLNASLIKTVQAFWNLDHGQFEVALEEIISPFSQDKKLLQWQQELLIESLICQEQPNLALRALQARSSPINSLLEIKTLMANDLIAEAFHLARSKNDLDLLKTFFNGCLYLGKYSTLRDLALTEEEGKIVAEIFKETKSSKAGNLHFINLLQKSKYVEALTYLDELALSSHGSQNQKIVDLETTQLILSAYNVTMTPAVKSLADCYYKIRNRMENSSGKFENKNIPKPLSSQLLKQNANNLFGGIYHSSALSVDMATNYWDELKQRQSGAGEHLNYLLDSNNAPFVRKPQPDAFIDIMTPIKDMVSYPEVYKAAQKRRLGDDESFIFEKQNNDKDVLENPQKRRKIMEANESLISMKNNLSTKQSINTSLLTKFKDKKLNSSSLMDKTSTLNITPHQNNTDCSSSVVLNTPIVKSCRTDIKDNNSNDQFDMRSECVLTPQSILKVKNLIRSETPSLLHRSRSTLLRNSDQENASNASDVDDNRSENSSAVGDEEKLIRFELPIKNKISATNNEIRTASLHIKEDVNTVSCRYSCPQKRKSIRSADSSILSETSIDEFFSPLSSRDTSRIDSGNDSKVQINIEKDLRFVHKNVIPDDDINEPMDTSELTPMRADDKEISKDSGADVCTSAEVSSISTSNNRTSFLRYEGPKPRRPLSPSKTPPELRNTVLDSSRVCTESNNNLTRSSRSKTPDILLSPTRRSSRLSTKIQHEKTPEKQLIQPIGKQSTQKTLSRIVLESNTMKNVLSSVKIDESFQKLEEKLDEQTNELNKEISLLKTDTQKFEPLISSSKVAATTSSFSESKDNRTQNRASEYTTVEGEISFNDSLAGVDIMSKTFAQHIASPKSFLPADISIVTDGYKDKNQDHNQTLMTTMDMSNISFNSTMFGAPENILSDSSMEEIQEHVEEAKPETELVHETSPIKDDAKIDDTINYNENVNKVVQKLDLKEENVIINKDIDESVEQSDIQEKNNKETKQGDYKLNIDKTDQNIEDNRVINTDLEICRIKTVTEQENSSDSSLCGIELYSNSEISEDNESESGLESELDNPIIYTEEQSTNDTMNSTSSKSNENNETNEYLSAEDQHLVINISSSSESPIKSSSSSSNEIEKIPESYEDVSDLLYGDIDKEEIQQEDSDAEMEDYNDLNKQIYDTSEICLSNVADVPTTDNVEPCSSFDDKSDGKNINFLTGEEDDEQITEGLLKVTPTKENNEMEIELENKDSTHKNDEENISMRGNPLDIAICGEISDISQFENTQLKEDVNTELDTTVEANTSVEDADNSMNVLNVAIVTASTLTTPKIYESVNLGSVASKNMEETTQKNTVSSEKDSENIIKMKENTIDSDDDVQLKVSDDDDNQNSKIYSVGIDTEKTFNNNSNNNKTTLEKQQKYNLRKVRAESIDKDSTVSIKRNVSRATSVPRTIESSGTPIYSPKSKLRKRADSTDCSSFTPKQIIKRRHSTLLDQIEENSPLDSPARRTRSRLRLDSIDSDKTEIFEGIAGPSTSTTPMSSKRGRKTSAVTPSSNTTDEVTKTPRGTRAKSVLSEDNSQTPKRVSRRLSLAKSSPIKEESEKIISDNESEKSTKKKSGRIKLSTSKEIIDNIEIKDSDIRAQKSKDNVEEYAGSRRLTRTQKNVMEKSITTTFDPKTVPLKKRQAKSTNYDTVPDDPVKGDVSDGESISSHKSKKSITSVGAATRRATRSSGPVKESDDDNVSIISSTKSSKSVSGKKKTSLKTKESITESLMVIPEADQENEDTSNASSDNESATLIPPRKKGRQRSKRNK